MNAHAATWLLGLDIGTTATRVVAYDPALGGLAALAERPTPVRHPTSTTSEHDPEELAQAAAGCLREVAAQAPRGAIAGLAVSSFAEAGVPLDREGWPLSPIIAWYDRRTEPQAAWWEEQLSPEELHAITGQRVSPSFGANKWLWFREHAPEAAANMAVWLSVPDYILWLLTGEQATDYTIASRTMLLDQRTLTWSERMLGLAGLSVHQLPTPRPSGTRSGLVTAEAALATGLPAGTPCALGGHDHLCAAFAAGAVDPGEVIDSSGTAQAVLAVVPDFRTSARMGEAGYACYPHVVPGRYVLKAGLKLAGGAVEWLARRLGEVPYAELEALARPGVGVRAGPLWLPHWLGSGTPEGDRYSQAALAGVRAEHDRGDLFRGLLEGLAFWLRHNLEEMQTLGAEPAGQVTLLGGVTRLALLTEFKAAVVGLPMLVPALPQASATGAALLAGLGTGVFAGPAEAAASLRCPRTTTVPDPALVAWYGRLYEEAYRPLYPALRDVHHALARLSAPDRSA